VGSLDGGAKIVTPSLQGKENVIAGGRVTKSEDRILYRKLKNGMQTWRDEIHNKQLGDTRTTSRNSVLQTRETTFASGSHAGECLSPSKRGLLKRKKNPTIS